MISGYKKNTHNTFVQIKQIKNQKTVFIKTLKQCLTFLELIFVRKTIILTLLLNLKTIYMFNKKKKKYKNTNNSFVQIKQTIYQNTGFFKK